MMLRVGVLTPQGILTIALEKRFEFKWNGLPCGLWQNKINETFGDTDLSCRLKTEHIVAKRGK